MEWVSVGDKLPLPKEKPYLVCYLEHGKTEIIKVCWWKSRMSKKNLDLEWNWGQTADMRVSEIKFWCDITFPSEKEILRRNDHKCKVSVRADWEYKNEI